jgi:8-oxo-dGTP pyrophosphatase MutT (NUDIX family)
MSIDPQTSDRDMCCDCGPFYLDVVGRFAPDRIGVIDSPSRRASTPEVDSLIDTTWLAALAEARKTGRHLYDGRLHRLVDYRCEGGVLSLTLGPASFKEFLGTNLTHAYLRHVHGPEMLADVLGVSAAVCTSDGYIVLGRRGAQVASHGGRIHPVGGLMESAGPGQPPPHPADAILRELQEELGITSAEVLSNTCMGMVRDRHIVQPELVFDVRVNVDVQRLRRFQPAPEHQEHSELIPVRDHPSAVVTFIQRCYDELTPVGLATLLLHGLGQWGSGWFATTRGYLRSVV